VTTAVDTPPWHGPLAGCVPSVAPVRSGQRDQIINCRQSANEVRSVFGLLEVLGDILFELFAPGRRQKGKPPKEPRTVRRSRRRMERHARRRGK
jgi:hypothetical protein